MRPAQDPQPDHWPVGRLLSAAARRLERAWDAHLATWDLNHASLPVLVHLAARDVSQRELADACGVTEQTMSRVVARLERSQYVSRHRDGADRRRHVITLTDAGRAALTAAADPRPAEDEVLGSLSPDRLALLGDLLREVVRPGDLAAGTAAGATRGGPPADRA